MTADRIWTIGAASENDLVIGEASVSSRHCQLVWRSGRWELEDRGSTNGTYVNGNRIASPTVVTDQDRITLGPDVDLSWELIDNATQSREIRVGRAADNDVVLEEPQVSAHHLKFVLTADQWWVVDLNSSNGTAVQAADKRVDRAQVRETDTVFLGSAPFVVRDLLQRADGRTAELPRAVPAGWYRIAAAAVVLALVGWMLAQRGNDSQHDAPDNSTPTAETDSDEDSVPTLPAQPDIPGSLWAVVVRRPNSEASLQIGTAFAVGPHQLLTTATVVKAQEKFRKESKDWTWGLCCTNAGSLLSPTQVKIHPVFERLHAELQVAAKSATELQGRYNALREELDSQPDARAKTEAEADIQKLEQFREDFLQADAHWFQLNERLTCVDVAVLEVAQELPAASRLPATIDQESDARGNVVWGLPRISSNLALHENSEAQSLPARFTSRNIPDEQAAVAIMQYACSGDANRDHNWLGSPVFNQKLQVVGVYVRQTPNYREPLKPPTGESFDAIELKTIHELLR